MGSFVLAVGNWMSAWLELLSFDSSEWGLLKTLQSVNFRLAAIP